MLLSAANHSLYVTYSLQLPILDFFFVVYSMAKWLQFLSVYKHEELIKKHKPLVSTKRYQFLFK